MLTRLRVMTALIAIVAILAGIYVTRPVGVFGAVITAGSMSAANATVNITTDSNNVAAVGMQISGTFTATLVFEATIDGANWFSINCWPVAATNNVAAGAPVSSTTAAGQFVCPVFGYNQERVRISAFTSGAAIVSLDFSSGNLPALLPGGQLITPVNLEVQKATYIATTSGFTPPATPTDFARLQGSATKTIRVLQACVSGLATAATNVLTFGRIYSSAGTFGSVTALTAVPNDSNSVAATAAAQVTTANPTVGTLVGSIAADQLFLASTTAAPNGAQPLCYSYPVGPGQAVVLRGTAQYFAFNWAGAAVPAGTVLTIKLMWTEE